MANKRENLNVQNPKTLETFNLEDILTVKEVMRIFDVTVLTIYNWLGDNVEGFYSDGKFPNAFKLGKEIYIPIKDVTALVENKSTVNARKE